MMFRARLLCLLSLLSFTITSTRGQELVDYMPFTEDDGLDLTQGPELLDIAAPAGSRIRIPLSLPSQIAVVQEIVEANIDCQPWSSMFEGEVTWFREIPGDPGK